jgi:hypothetical protein
MRTQVISEEIRTSLRGHVHIFMLMPHRLGFYVWQFDYNCPTLTLKHTCFLVHQTYPMVCAMSQDNMLMVLNNNIFKFFMKRYKNLLGIT